MFNKKNIMLEKRDITSLSNDKMMVYMAQKKNEALFGISSLILPGLGQILGGAYFAGIFLFFFDLMFYFSLYVSSMARYLIYNRSNMYMLKIAYVIILFWFVIWIVNVIDAVQIAKKYNKKLLNNLLEFEKQKPSNVNYNYCEQCGNKLQGNAKFCSSCGAKISE
jgi:TM2 domain-containing membrane protein YozV